MIICMKLVHLIQCIFIKFLNILMSLSTVAITALANTLKALLTFSAITCMIIVINNS